MSSKILDASWILREIPISAFVSVTSALLKTITHWGYKSDDREILRKRMERAGRLGSLAITAVGICETLCITTGRGRVSHWTQARELMPVTLSTLTTGVAIS